jgi:myo-inositol-1-phosphate synthase
MSDKKTGIWFIGARGGVATTASLGLVALEKGLVDHTGLVTGLPPFARLSLPAWSDLVVGGHDIRRCSLLETARTLAASHAVDLSLVEKCSEGLAEINHRVRPGAIFHSGPAIDALAEYVMSCRTPREAIDRVKEDITAFSEELSLGRVIVVNVASTEPATDIERLPQKWADLSKLLDTADSPLRASTCYAIAAFELGMPFINFTPSLGSACPALEELALKHGVCHCGRDGKTGETLLKTVLAPMFAHRNLQVMSWVGHNIFGNLDGKVLDDPAHKASKVTSKDHVLGGTLGYDPQTLVTIEYIESMGDWKTAWDHIHFRGFLGTPMTMQFIWQGSDSLLAAPLVLDLVRLVDYAARRGEKGALPQLASFFKSPMGTTEHDFFRQFESLIEWAQ